MSKSALGRGLGSLIPQNKETYTEKVIPDAKQEVLEISIDKIQENPHQPRKHFSPSDLEDLISSIKQHGILQPIIVTKQGDGYELVAGERRFRSAKTLGFETVPAIVRDASEQQKLEWALIENVQRQELNPVEEAYAYKALIDEFNLTQEKVGAQVGKSRSAIANILRLLELDEEALDALKSGKITKSHARTLLSEPDEEKRHQMLQAMLKGELTVREAEAKIGGSGKKGKAGMKAKDPNILAHEKKLREILGTKVSIQEKAGKGKIVIDFYSKEEFINILDILSGF